MVRRRPGRREARGAGAGGEGKGGGEAWAGRALNGRKAGVGRGAQPEGWRGMARARGSAAESQPGNREDLMGTGWLLRAPASPVWPDGPPGPSPAKVSLTQWKFSCLSVFLMPELISEVDHVIPSSERVSSSLRVAAYSGKESSEPQKPFQA